MAKAAGLHVSRIDGSPLEYNAADPWLPDFLVCRQELADDVLADDAGLTRLALGAVDLMNRDIKETSLKALQGMIWRGGYETGEIVAHVFDDVPPALAQWADGGNGARVRGDGRVAPLDGCRQHA